ncbi:SAM hydrolase/SAM-dependent halogenase family protein [Aeoliella mucimassa]|uniref:Adenosyl-chloride synthase n=1 Tax=Aeoliella mucimassa TaxID=2527972 RepID=A0A518AP13_9BACT|nr:SAM-dependent chlorinase/fluorinase [Aeoliella mucimassa]QDU56431.1 Adenosyl-chloride synthase [Aeoliella mucimassa]
MNHRPIVTLTTDFGEGSRYVGAMKGALLAVCPELTIVDISHAVPHQNVLQAAITLVESTPYFPPQTIHVAVIDPGVGTNRRILYAEIDGQRYIGPDNGIFTCLADRAKPSTMRSVENTKLWRCGVSSTFHGRDIMAPVAAHLAAGVEPAEVGPEIDDFIRIPLPQAERVANKIEGEVTEVDSFGNLITNITTEMLADVPRGEETRICCDGHETMGIFAAYGDQPPMTLIALVGSGDKLELAIVDDSAKIMLGVTVGTPLTVEW